MKCPRCKEVMVVMRNHGVALEVCQNGCGGVWLDAGELTHIYSLYATEAERVKAASEYLNAMFGPDFKRLKSESEDQTYRKVARVLQHVAPSYYLRRLF